MALNMSFLTAFSSASNIVVIGASGGVGRGFVNVLQDNGFEGRIFAFSRSGTEFQNVRNERIDIADERSIESAARSVEEAGGADVIIVASGILHDDEIQPEKSMRDFDFQTFQKVFAINTFGPALVAKHFAPLLPKNEKGVFAALSARVGSISDNGLGGWTAYRASKSALNMVIKNISIEMQRRYKQAIIVGLHPGTVDTSLSDPFQGNVPKGKLFTSEYSAAQMLAVISHLSPKDSGKVFDYAGQEILA